MEIHIENLNKIFKKVQALDNINLEEKKKVKIKILSWNQKQRLGIAQAILNDP